MAVRSSIHDETIMADEQREHVTTTEARAGATPHMARHVLVIGTTLVIVLFAIILLVMG